MQIDNLTIKNFLGIEHLEVRPERLTLFCGPNGSGKTSIHDAVAFALTGNTARNPSGKKKDLPALLHNNARSGTIRIETSDKQVVERNVRDGKTNSELTLNDIDPDSQVLPAITKQDHFSSLTHASRRMFLFRMMGVEASQDTIRTMLSDRGFEDGEEIRRVMPLLRGGFGAAEQESRNLAREAKGGWKAVTGETWGADKGEDWVKKCDPGEAGNLSGARAALATARAEQMDINSKLNTNDTLVIQQQNAKDALAELIPKREVLGDKTKAQRLLNDSSERYTRSRIACELALQKLHEADEAKGDLLSGRVETTPLSCPHCGKNVWLSENNNALLGSGPCEDVKKLEAQAAAKAIENAEALMRDAQKKQKSTASEHEELVNICQNIDALDAQIMAYKAILDERQPYADEQTKRFEARDAELTTTISTIEQRIESAAKQERDAELAAQATVNASKYHHQILTYLNLADQLSPNGIPKELMDSALGPINDLLASFCETAEWKKPVVLSDMTITYGGRTYEYLSESERWRVDAMLTAAIAELSGIGFFILDRLDVLDLRCRANALNWLYALTSQMGLQVLVMATLKAPTKEAKDMRVVWLGEKWA